MKFGKYVLTQDILLPDFEAQMQGINRFLGREIKHPWALNNQPFILKLPLRSEYHQALQEGILAPFVEANDKRK